MSQCRTSAFVDHLDHRASLSSKMYNIASLWEEFTFEWQNPHSTMQDARDTLWVHSLLWCFTMRRVSPSLLDFLFLIWIWMQHINNQIPEIKCGNSVHALACIERNNFRFRWIVWHTCLFLAQPAHRNKCVASKYAQCSTWGRFWIFKIFHEVRVLKQSQTVFWAVFPTWQQCLYSFVIWMYEIKLARRLLHVLVHFVIARASFFTDHRISGLLIRAKHRHF